ncbi:MAG: dihydrodipicolinate synthase family protein [Actinomycetota bacterium]|nr:dihydrodipicolinate synthase family protein [Actinomycetota bacterium]
MTERGTNTATVDKKAPFPFGGVVPIVVTPFTDDDHVDLDQLGAEIDFLRAAGFRWAGLGYGSECARMGSEELTQVTAFASARGNGELMIVGNAEMSSVVGGVEQLTNAQDSGAHAGMLRLRGFEGVEEGELFDAIASVAQQAGIPIVLQDALQTGVSLSPRLLARVLSEIPQAIALKTEAPGGAAHKIEQVISLATVPNVAIFGGAGGQDYPHELESGAIGSMPGPAFPEIFRAVGHLWDQGERSDALQMFARILPLIQLGNRDFDTFLYVQKVILIERGVLSTSNLRRPHRTLAKARIRREVQELLGAMHFFSLLNRCEELLAH